MSNDILPHDKFIDRWARLFIHKLNTVGNVAAERWAAQFMNKRDYPRLKERIHTLRNPKLA